MDEIFQRIQANWKLKLVFSAGLTGVFLIFYFFLQNDLVFPVTVMAPTWIDRCIPFWPGAVFLYESLWLFMPIAPWMLETRKEFYIYSLGMILIMVFGFSVFFFFPTAITRLNNPDHTHALYNILIRIDNERNAFPSLHCAFVLYHAAYCEWIFRDEPWQKWFRRLIWIWGFGIIVSTLLTKQHVFYDATAGSILGLGCFAVCYQLTKRSWFPGFKPD